MKQGFMDRCAVQISGNKREVILRAAMELIAERGFQRTPTSMIAERAGVAIGSIYRYFDSKDALIVTLNREIETEAMKFITDGYDCGRPLRERYFHVATRMMEHMMAHPSEFRFVEQFYNSPYGMAIKRGKLFAETVLDNNTDLLRGLYEQGRSQQIIRDFDLSIFFSLAFGSLFNVVREHITGFTTLDDQAIEMIVGACWDAVKL
jgi:AcrR family transcriptional regulator